MKLSRFPAIGCASIEQLEVMDIWYLIADVRKLPGLEYVGLLKDLRLLQKVLEVEEGFFLDQREEESSVLFDDLPMLPRGAPEQEGRRVQAVGEQDHLKQNVGLVLDFDKRVLWLPHKAHDLVSAELSPA